MIGIEEWPGCVSILSTETRGSNRDLSVVPKTFYLLGLRKKYDNNSPVPSEWHQQILVHKRHQVNGRELYRWGF